jgi:hypothetical protein
MRDGDESSSESSGVGSECLSTHILQISYLVSYLLLAAQRRVLLPQFAMFMLRATEVLVAVQTLIWHENYRPNH